VLAVVLIALQWCLLLISGGRGATLALSVTLVLGLALGWRRARGWLTVQACGLALGTLLFAGFLAAQGTLFEASSSDVSPAGTEDKSAQVARQSIGHYTAPHSSGRNQLWSAALREARAQPWLGIGPARFACAPNRGAGAHPHSFAMQVLSEWGLPAAALLGLVAAWLALRVLLSLIRADRDDAHWLLRYSLGLSLAALGGHALLSGVPVVPAGQMALTLAIGWLLGLQGSGATAAPLLRGALLLAPTLLAGLWLAAAGTGAGLKMHQDDPANGGSMPKPRLWQDGEICRYDQGSAKGQ
jgi:O-antigen ligase